jgi:hypothetical protein
MPHEASLRTIYSYYLSTVNVNPEGDVNLSDELNLQGLGNLQFSLVIPVKPIQKLAEVLDLEAPNIALVQLALFLDLDRFRYFEAASSFFVPFPPLFTDV